MAGNWLNFRRKKAETNNGYNDADPPGADNMYGMDQSGYRPSFSKRPMPDLGFQNVAWTFLQLHRTDPSGPVPYVERPFRVTTPPSELKAQQLTRMPRDVYSGSMRTAPLPDPRDGKVHAGVGGVGEANYPFGRRHRAGQINMTR